MLLLAHVRQGKTLAGLGNHEGDVAAYDQALELDPQQAHHNRAYALLSKGDYEGALTAYDRVLEVDPKDAVAHNNRGDAVENLGNHRVQSPRMQSPPMSWGTNNVQ